MSAVVKPPTLYYVGEAIYLHCISSTQFFNYGDFMLQLELGRI